MISRSIEIILLAVLLRLLIMPFYFHPDIKTYHFQASFFRQGVFNIYSYLDEHKQELPFKEEFVYFPLTYFFLGGYQFVALPFLGNDFDSWLQSGGIGSAEQIGTFRYLFILKLPYLILDIIIAFLLASFFKEEKEKQRALLLWLFNPFSISLIYIFSNVDILAITFVVLSVLLTQRKKMILAALCLGIGAGFKAYPLIFLPILLLYAHGIRQKSLVLLTTLGTLVLIIAPFIGSIPFRQSTMVSGLTTRMLIPIINLGFDETLFIAILPFSFICFYIWIKGKTEIDNLARYFLAILLLLYSFIHYHIQWLLWAIPLAVIVIVKKESLKWVLVSIGVLACLIPLLYSDKSMSVDLLKPISLWYDLVPIPFSIVSNYYSPVILQSILHSVLAGASFAVAWFLITSQDK